MRNFEGSSDKSAIVLAEVFPESDLVISTPLGRWIAVTPPEDDLPRTILHYEAAADFEKVRLLNFVLREQLAKICGFYLAAISVFFIKFDGREIDRKLVALPDGFLNGTLKLPQIKTGGAAKGVSLQ